VASVVSAKLALERINVLTNGSIAIIASIIGVLSCSEAHLPALIGVWN